MTSFAAQASFISLDAGAYRHNARIFRELIGPGVRLGAVLKGNAYGHGLAQMLPLAHEAYDALYVIDPFDGLAVRALETASGVARKQVLVLGAIGEEEAVELARAGVEVTLSNPGEERFVAALRKARVKLRAHIHLDTGLGREGFMPSELPARAAWISAAQDVIQVAGVLSHFANTEDVTEQEYAAHQLARFDEGARLLGLPGPFERHIAASAAAMLMPGARHDAVRVGIASYGLWPSNDTRLSARAVLGRVPDLRPVLSWRCKSQLTKWLPAGSYVGYGCTFRCGAETRIAVLPVGYFDGYPRIAQARAHVLVNGQRCPILGRIMMNHLVVDVTHAAPASSAGGEPVTATLLGHDGDEHLPAEQLAAWAQTINYEIVTRLGAHLRRVAF